MALLPLALRRFFLVKPLIKEHITTIITIAEIAVSNSLPPLNHYFLSFLPLGVCGLPISAIASRISVSACTFLRL